MAATAPVPIPVSVESGRTRVFASALDWPGWSRGARSEAEALASLLAYAPRYARIVEPSPGGFTVPRDGAGLGVVDRLTGGSGTDFGVPSHESGPDGRPMAAAEVDRQVAILHACWAAFDGAVAAAQGIELRKGPWGGGRDLDRILSHVVEADEAYLVQLGARPPRTPGSLVDRVAPLRATIEQTFRARAAGEAPATAVKRPWSPRYFARRCAWHVLDHAWEIEDRAAPG